MSAQTTSTSLFRRRPLFSHEEARQLLAHVWPSVPSSLWPDDALEAVFYYVSQELAFEEPSAHYGECLDDITNIRSVLYQHPGASKSLLVQTIREEYPKSRNDDRSLASTIDLVARLWLMINTKEQSELAPKNMDTSITWPDEQSLVDLFHNHFQPSVGVQLGASTQRFPRSFNVMTLEKFGGFRIRWTDNLLDHLKLDEGNTIRLFYHVSVLRLMNGEGVNQVLPPRFLEETLDTISLLIPRYSKPCLEWFREQQRHHKLDPEIERLPSGSRLVARYSFWRERLEILEEELKSSEPATMSQWWYDRRRKVQWYTFWVAVLVLLLTVFFGLVQSVTGIVQAWASIQALKGAGGSDS